MKSQFPILGKNGHPPPKKNGKVEWKRWKMGKYVMGDIISKFNSSKDDMKIKLIENLVNIYGHKIPIDGKVSEHDIETISKIAKKYNFKAKKIFTEDFYRELYLNVPI